MKRQLLVGSQSVANTSSVAHRSGEANAYLKQN